MSDFLKSMIKLTGNPYASVASNGLLGADVEGFIDTGCYSLNAILSGSIYNGLANNKITQIAGESGVGKTYVAMSICKEFLDQNDEAQIIYFDSENAVTKDMFENRGMDTDRIAPFPIATVEDFKTQALQIVNAQLAKPKDERVPLLIVLDSLGMLSTSKEMVDTADGKDTTDMTRARMIKAAFRVLTLKCGQAGIPLVVTNHTYMTINMYPTKVAGGGSGLGYAASTTLFLSRSKDKTDEGVVGNFIRFTNQKNRFVKENIQVETRLSYTTGLSKYYGLTALAVKYGIFSKNGTRIEMPDGAKIFEKTIDENPEKYYTKAVLDKLDAAIQKDFKYGQND